jgi:hypothetical protein
MPRVLKQLFYGLFYFAILALMAGGVYWWLAPAPSCFDNKLNQSEEDVDCGGPCLSCEVKRLRAIKALPLQLFGLNGRTTILLELQNPNLNYGAHQFNYEIGLYDPAGNLLRSIKDASFIYPGEIKTIVIPALEIDPRLVGRGEVKISNPLWEPIVKFAKPIVETREIVTRVEGPGVAVQGVVRNGNPFALARLNISAVVINKNGLLVNASKTFVADLKPFEERFFKISIPLHSGEAAEVDSKRTRVFAEIIK